MRIQLRLFAFAKQIVGHNATTIELDERATIADLRHQLVKTYPELSALASHLRFSVDAQYVADDVQLSEGADVACIPPVSGG